MVSHLRSRLRGLVERAYGPPRPGALSATFNDLRRWQGTRPALLLAAGWAAALVVLIVVGDALTLQRAALGVYLLIALYGLRILVVQTAQPSLGHAAFLAVGAYLTAFLRLRAGLDGLEAAALSMLVAGCLGWLVGWGASRLRPAFLALSTWAFGWLVVISIGSFPTVSGGVAGITFNAPVVIRYGSLGILVRFNEAGHLVLGSCLLALVLLGLRSTEESWLGQAWAAIRDSDALASSLGYNVAGMKRWAFFAAAALAGLSGSLAAQMLGVVDPTLYAATVSLGMFVAVLIGSRLGFFGPFLGIGVIGGLPIVAGDLMPSASTAPARGVAVAGLTLVALLLSLRGGLRQAPLPPSAEPETAVKASRRRRAASRGEPQLVATGISRNFGGVQALDSVDLEVAEGELHALIGPNGSGKSTLLKCLAGSIAADSGHVLLGGTAVDGLSESGRSRAGLVRTFQRVVVMPDLNPRQHLELGLTTRSEDAGWLAALLKTPGYRASAAERRHGAESLLETFGLGAFGDSHPETLPGGRQRLLQVATAVATRPRVLLLDEPAAGMGQPELEVLARALERLRETGLSIVVVEHNIGFVRRIADRVSVLDGGRLLATGTPRQVVANRRVRAAYLGGATTRRS